MKKIAKLMLLVLAVAIFVTMTSVVVFAEGDLPKITSADINKLAELYKENLYYAEDFESDVGIKADSDLVDTSGVVKGPQDIGGNTVLKLDGAPSDNDDVYISASAVGDITGVVFETRIAAEGGVFTVYVGGMTASDTEIANMPVVSFDFSEGEISVHKQGFYGMPKLEVLGGASLIKGAWYYVSVVYDAVNASYSLVVEQQTDSDGNPLAEPVVISEELPGMLTSVTQAKVTVSGASIDGAELMLDDVYFYGGTSFIDYKTEETKLIPAVLYLLEKFESNKARNSELLELFVAKREISAPEYADEIKYAGLILAEYYVDEYDRILASYNSGDKFAERAEKIESIVAAGERVPKIPEYTEEEGAEKYQLMRTIYNRYAALNSKAETIVEEQEYIRARSEEFIEYMSDKDATSNLYEDIKGWIVGCDITGVDPTYYDGSDKNDIRDISRAYSDYVRILEKVVNTERDCATYIECVEILKNAEKSFIERYNAYNTASAIRFLDVDFSFYIEKIVEGNPIREYPLRDTYGNGGVLIKKGAISEFEELSEQIEEIEKVCINFIDCITDAKSATNISNLDISLAKAEKYDMTEENTDDNEGKIALEFDYPGVREAITDYAALCKKKIDDKKLADDFIAKVELLRAAKTRAEIRAAIEDAKEIYPENILNGFEGYSEALSYLTEVEATLVYNESRAKSFISIVNSLSTAKTYKEKHGIINAAKAYLSDLDEEIEGVSLAKALLSANIAVYNAEMERANDDFEQTVHQTAKIASVAAPTDAFLRVVAIIKRIFDLD